MAGSEPHLSLAELLAATGNVASEQEERAEKAEAALEAEREKLAKLESSYGLGEANRCQPAVTPAGEPVMHSRPTGDWVCYLDYDHELAQWIAATEEKDEERHGEKLRAEKAEAALAKARKEGREELKAELLEWLQSKQADAEAVRDAKGRATNVDAEAYWQGRGHGCGAAIDRLNSLTKEGS